MINYEYNWKKINYDKIFPLNDVFDDEIVEEGWEFAGKIDDFAVFKRAYENDIECGIDNIEYELDKINSKLEELKSREVVLIGLVQALVEKFCPDSEFLLSLKANMGLENNSPEKNIPSVKSQIVKEKNTVTNHDSDIQTTKEECNNIVKQESFVKDNIISDFADEHIEKIMNGYQDEDKSLGLFAIIVGFGVLLPYSTIEYHHRYMIKALYRYYTKNQDEKIVDCFVEALNIASMYLSSPITIKQLNEITESSISIADGIDAFFDIIIAQLDFEKNTTSPFKVSQISEFIKIFMEQIKNNTDLYDNIELMAKIEQYSKCIQQKHNLEFSVY